MRFAEHHDLEPIYVWDIIVRLTHWIVAGSIVVLALTGLYISHPIFVAPGPASEHFVMGTVRVVHFYTAIVFTLAVFARVIWMFTGPRRSSWRNFIPASKRRLRDLGHTLKFYALLKPTPPVTIGHNPLAGLSYVGVFVLYLLMILTGFAMYSAGARSFMHGFGFLVPLFHGLQTARWLHHLVMWVLIVFVTAHIFLSLLTSRSEKNGVVDSIFSGWKFLPKNQPPDDADE